MFKGWYNFNFTGGLLLGLSAWSDVYTYFFYDLIGSFILNIVGITYFLIILLVLYAKKKNIRIFEAKKIKSKGFSLIELLIVISIIGILTSMIMPTFNSARKKARETRALLDFKSIQTSLEMYATEYGDYPPDADRDIPPGLEEYLQPGIWPDAAWPGSIFDWDNWIDPVTHKKIQQISVRFCPLGGGIETCQFPDEDWAENFDTSSAVYFCISGVCRSHINKPIDHPGYCINCIE